MCTYSQVTQAHWQTHTQAKSLTNMRDTVGAPVSSLPGSRRLRSTGTQYLLGAQVSWLRQVRVTLVAASISRHCLDPNFSQTQLDPGFKPSDAVRLVHSHSIHCFPSVDKV